MDEAAASRSLWEQMDVRGRRGWTSEERQAHQESALGRLRAYAYAGSPFYQRFHRGLTDRPLTELPVLTKAAMMEHFDELVTDRSVRKADVEAHWWSESEEAYLGRYWLTSTSGSSGLRGLFVHDRSELTAVLTSFGGAYVSGRDGNNRGKPGKFAMITTTATSGLEARLAQSARQGWGSVLNLDATEPLGNIVEQLNNWQPESLTSYASVLTVLADEQLAGRLQISPGAIFSTAEVLTDTTRHRAMEAWGDRIFNLYGSTEGGLLAAECGQHRGMHLLEDLFLAEVVDEDNRPVPPGVTGEKVLITVLFRQTQPLIRYELSDMIRLAPEPCPCGSSYRLLDGIQGRNWEVLHFPAATGGEVAIQPAAFDYAMESIQAEWQVVQEPDLIRVLLANVRGELDPERLAAEVHGALEELGAIPPPVRVDMVASIPRNEGGKAPLVRSTLPRPVARG